MSTALGIEMKTTALPMVEDKDGQRVADALSNVLADTFVLYLKTHSFHWNGYWSNVSDVAPDV